MATENVTTKFKVDISDLKKSITEANRQVKLYRAELQNANAGMKKGEENADSLSRKIEAQSKIVQAEQQKLEALKQELVRYEERVKQGQTVVDDLTKKHKAAADAFGEDSEEAKKLAKQLVDAQAAQERNVTAADKLRVSIVNQDTAVKNAEGKVRDFSDALDDLQKSENQSSDESENLAKSIKDTDDESEKASKGGIQSLSVALGNLASTAITLVIKKLGEMAKAAADAFEQFDEGRSNLIKETGATGAAADELTKVYADTAKSVTGDLGDIGSAIGEVNTRFGFTGDALQNATQDFIKFADVTGTDAVNAVQLVSRAMGDAGIDAENYTDVLDQLAAASQASGISVDKLTEYLTKYGAPMRSLGFDTQESISIFSQWEKAGVNTEIAFSGMKTAISKWSSEGKDAKKEFQKTLEEISKTPDIASATTKAIEVFGKKAGPDLADAIKGGRFEYSAFLDIIKNSSGTVQQTYEEAQSGIDKIKLAVQGLSVTVGEAAGKVVEEFAPKIENIIQLFQGVLTGEDDAQENLADSVAEFIAGAIDKALQVLPSFSGTIVRTVVMLTRSLASVAPDIVKALAGVIKSVLLGLTGLLPDLMQTVTDALPDVMDALFDAAPDIVKAVTELTERVAAKLPEIIKKLVGYVPAFVQGIADLLTEQTPVIIKAVIDIFTGLVQALPGIVQALVDVLPSLIQTVTDFIANNAPMVLESILMLVQALVQAAPQIAAAIYPMIPQIVDILVEGFMNFIPVWIDTAKKMFGMLAQEIPNLWKNVKDASEKIFQSWKTNIFDRARKAFGEIWDHIKDKVAPVGNKIGEAVGSAFKSTINEILTSIEERLNSIPNAINGAIDTLNKLPGVSISPMDTISLPRLAKGGIIDKATLAQIGEAGREAVIPLENNRAGLREIANLLREEMRVGSGVGQAAGTNVTLTQNISSPKALSEYEIWRQTKNMLNLMKEQGV